MAGSGHAGVSGFDLVDHHRRRARRAEQRADHLERVNAKLWRLLADAAVLIAGPDVDPLVAVRVLEGMDEIRGDRRRAWTDDELVQLLRATDPAAVTGRAA